MFERIIYKQIPEKFKETRCSYFVRRGNGYACFLWCAILFGTAFVARRWSLASWNESAGPSNGAAALVWAEPWAVTKPFSESLARNQTVVHRQPRAAPPPLLLPSPPPALPPVVMHMNISRPIIGEYEDFTSMEPNEVPEGIVFSGRNPKLPGESMDTGFACFALDIPDAEKQTYHVSELAPFFGERDLPHHMDIFACGDSIPSVYPAMEVRACANAFEYVAEKQCDHLVWAYDRGAKKPFKMPAGTGYLVGKGTSTTKLLLQIHYLIPYQSGVTAQQLKKEQYIDRSGVSVTLTPDSPIVSTLPIASFFWYSFNLVIPQQPGVFEFRSKLYPTGVEELVGAQIRSAGGSIQLRRLHAHAHHQALKVAVIRWRPVAASASDAAAVDESVIINLDPYCGYGECQTFHDLDAGGGFDLRLGDTLEIRCSYTNVNSIDLVVGVSALQEMCGPVFLFTPFDHTVPWVQYHLNCDATLMLPNGSMVTPQIENCPL